MKSDIFTGFFKLGSRQQIEMTDKHDQLVRIFCDLFQIEAEAAPGATMDNTESWDSVNHMNLILEIETELIGNQVSPQKLVDLTSFSQCYAYVISQEE